MAKVAVIGAGFSGLSAAAYLAKAGHQVTVFEKNESIGGRARQFKTESGYVFDMGPSWYWMPDVFDRFFADFGTQASAHYRLDKLDPGFEMVFKGAESMAIPAEEDKLAALCETLETGSGVQLHSFLKDAGIKYQKAMKELVYMPGNSIREFLSLRLLLDTLRLRLFTPFSRHVRRYFKHPKLLALMEFPVLFLGAMPKETPALYSLMNYAGLAQGTFYPQGGFGEVVKAIGEVAKANGVLIRCNSPVDEIRISGGKAKGLMSGGNFHAFDAIVASADYAHVEQALLPEQTRNYTGKYWESRVLAPSCLIFYMGFNKKIDRLEHHTLFFDEDLHEHSVRIYKEPSWPEKPLFYVCCPSKTDTTVAPVGHENLFLLMPIAPGLEDSEALREKYFSILMERLSTFCGDKDLLAHLDFKRSYCVSEFIEDYHSLRGNAYGLANTLRQTAFLKPKMKNKKLKNLFYTGQLTVPGPGVPPALISGKIVANQVDRLFTK